MLDEYRNSQSLITRVFGQARFTIAPDRRHAGRCACAEKSEFHLPKTKSQPAAPRISAARTTTQYFNSVSCERRTVFVQQGTCFWRYFLPKYRMPKISVRPVLSASLRSHGRVVHIASSDLLAVLRASRASSLCRFPFVLSRSIPRISSQYFPVSRSSVRLPVAGCGTAPSEAAALVARVERKFTKLAGSSAPGISYLPPIVARYRVSEARQVRRCSSRSGRLSAVWSLLSAFSGSSVTPSFKLPSELNLRRSATLKVTSSWLSSLPIISFIFYVDSSILRKIKLQKCTELMSNGFGRTHCGDGSACEPRADALGTGSRPMPRWLNTCLKRRTRLLTLSRKRTRPAISQI